MVTPRVVGGLGSTLPPTDRSAAGSKGPGPRVKRVNDHVYRAPMRSRRDDVDPGLAAARAFSEGVCGVGGRLPRAPVSAADAVALTAEVYDDRTARRLERFMAVPVGAEVWTRHPDGMFHRGSLTGAWSWDGDAAAYEADLVHVRPCDWDTDPLPEHRTPPAVVATYRRGGRNFQRITRPGSGGAPPGARPRPPGR